MPKIPPLSILLLDDNRELVDHYKAGLEKYAGLHVTAETDSLRARALAEKQLFDVVVIDAKLQYRGFEFGGLRLADDLRPRYGANSVLIISRFITDSFARVSELSCDFMEKYGAETRKSFARDLCRKLREMRRQQFAFVAMPFGSQNRLIYQQIRKGVMASGLKCVRVDKIPHNRSIQEVIFDLVEKSKVVVFLAEGGNPNAYYEAGFADAMQKEIIILAESAETLPFDIRSRNSVFYGGNKTALAGKLKGRIKGIRLIKPVGL